MGDDDTCASGRDQSVWVLTANIVDNPHPEVLGVYSNEKAAKRHGNAIESAGYTIRDDGFDWSVASFSTYEVGIDDRYTTDTD